VLIKRYVPSGTAAAASKPAGTYGMEALPAVLSQRRQNRGFEGIAFYNNKLYLFVQSPLRNPVSLSSATLNGMKNVRVIEFNPVTETTTGQYIYILDNDPAVVGSATDTRADKIGDATSLGNGEFLVLERDDDAIDSDPLSDIKKKIYRFSLEGATNILSLPNVINGKTADQMSLAELRAAGIAPITKYLHIDLATAGYNTTEKVEGLTLIDRSTIAVINDNDFKVGGLAINTTSGEFSPYPNPNGENELLGLITVRNNGFDASDRDINGTAASGGKINIRHWPVKGMYLPDGIARFMVDGNTYYITANEGDSRAYTGFTEEVRVGDAAYVLDSVAFPNKSTLKLPANLGRLQLTNASGNLDGDNDFDQIHAFGARSFSIWDSNGMLIYDSGDDLEQITASLTPTLFNSEGTAALFDTRSDNKGPEPEGVTTGVINGKTYAFIGLERVGDLMVYDISNPIKPLFIQYINTPEDLAVEGVEFVVAENSPTGKPLVITTAEVSKTVTVYEVNIPSISVKETSGLTNNDSIICLGAFATLTVSGSSPYSWSTGATTASITVTPGNTMTYSVTGCSLTTSKTIIVNPVHTCSITAVPDNTVYTGGIVSNLYLGYGPQKLTLNVSAPVAGAPYTYLWSGGILSNYNTANPEFTASTEGSFTFTVEVTNQFGCSSSCSITICVTDIRPLRSIGKVYVCQSSLDNPSNTNTHIIPVIGVAERLLHHPDYRLGKCSETPCALNVRDVQDHYIEDIKGGFSVKAFPNPTDSYVQLQILSDQDEPVEIRVLDIHGKSVYNKTGLKQGSLRFGHDFPQGIYFVETVQGKYRQILKLVKQ
ncbi:MAG: esterase-like activity of phytase family protein, partial [Saprospiraceae bacterium]